MKKYISLFLFSMLIWILLAGISINEIILGILVSLVIAVFFSKMTSIEFGISIVPKLILFIVVYVPIFIWQLVKSNIDVAYRVLSRKMPIAPGFVKVPVDIKSDVGKLVLANSITLTPGTISVDADDKNIYVHWIDVKEDRKKVSMAFEKILGRIFK